jgi:hypothetical protein
MDTAMLAWINDRLDEVLPERSEPAPEGPLRRGELMALVTEIDHAVRESRTSRRQRW